MMPRNITTADDLVTSHKATVDGFIKQAIEKNDRAQPYVQAASKLMEVLQGAKDIETVVKDSSIQNALFTASGLSDKAHGWLNETERAQSLARIIHSL